MSEFIQIVGVVLILAGVGVFVATSRAIGSADKAASDAITKDR